MTTTRWIACACAVSVLAPGGSAASDFKDTRYGYSVTPPEFAAVPPGAMATRVSFAAPPDAGFASNMGVMVQEVKTTRDEYLALSKRQFAEHGMTVRAPTVLEVSGRPALMIDYEGEIGGRRLRFLQLAVILPDRVLLATCTALASAFPALEAEFRKSLKSFKLASGR